MSSTDQFDLSSNHYLPRRALYDDAAWYIAQLLQFIQIVFSNDRTLWFSTVREAFLLYSTEVTMTKVFKHRHCPQILPSTAVFLNRAGIPTSLLLWYTRPFIDGEYKSSSLLCSRKHCIECMIARWDKTTKVAKSASTNLSLPLNVHTLTSATGTFNLGSLFNHHCCAVYHSVYSNDPLFPELPSSNTDILNSNPKLPLLVISSSTQWIGYWPHLTVLLWDLNPRLSV